MAFGYVGLIPCSKLGRHLGCFLYPVPDGPRTGAVLNRLTAKGEPALVTGHGGPRLRGGDATGHAILCSNSCEAEGGAIESFRLPHPL